MSSNATQLADQLTKAADGARLAAAEALATMGEEASSAAAALVAACDDPALRDTCVGALEELGPPDASQIDSLAELAGSEVELVAYWAATLLGRSGAAAAGHANRLAALAAGSPSDVVRRRCEWACEKIASDQ